MNVVRGVWETLSAARAYASSPVARRAVILYGSQLVFVLLGVATSTMNARLLGDVAYGTLAFFSTVAGFCVPFFRIGFFSSGALLLAHEKDGAREKELIGGILATAVLKGLAFGAWMLVTSLFVDRIFHTNIGYLLRVFCPMLAVLPAETLVSSLATGTSKTGRLAWFSVLPKMLYIAAVVLLIGFDRLTVSMAILLSLCALSASIVTVVWTFRPSFTNLRLSLRALWSKEKEYGIHLYWGRTFGQTTYGLDRLLIPYFVGTTNLGYYALGMAITSPVAMFSRSLSQTLFKGFADRERIPGKYIRLNFAWLAACTLGFVLFGRFVVLVLFGRNFLPIAPLILPLALAGFFQGMYQPLNFFIGAKGKGKWSRNMAMLAAVVNLVGNVALIPIWGAMGAAVVTCLSRLVSWAAHTYYYGRLRQEIRDVAKTV